jgi:hypothetical protein
MTVTGFIFSIETIRSSKGTMFRLRVNFTPEIIMLTKEVLFYLFIFLFTFISFRRYEF